LEVATIKGGSKNPTNPFCRRGEKRGYRPTEAQFREQRKMGRKRRGKTTYLRHRGLKKIGRFTGEGTKEVNLT